MRDDAEAAGIQTLRIEAPKGRSRPASWRLTALLMGCLSVTVKRRPLAAMGVTRMFAETLQSG
jgi:hypothetical protein